MDGSTTTHADATDRLPAVVDAPAHGPAADADRGRPVLRGDLHTGGFIAVPVVVAADRRITAAAKLVYGVIADDLRGNAEAWPGQPRIADRAGLSERGVRNVLRELVAVGLIVAADRAGRSTRYRFTPLPEPRNGLPGRQSLPGRNEVPDGQSVPGRNGLPGTPAHLAGPPRNGVPGTPEQSAADPTNGTNGLSQRRNQPAEAGGGRASGPKPRGRAKRATAGHPMPPIPTTLDAPAFREAWSLWERHLRERRKPLTPLAATHCLAELEALGPSRAAAAIRYSIGQGWLSIHERKHDGGGPPRPTPVPNSAVAAPGRRDD